MTALCQQVLGRAPARPVRGEKLAGRSGSPPITSHFSPLTSHVSRDEQALVTEPSAPRNVPELPLESA